MREVFLQNGQVATVNNPVYSPQYVQETTGIAGYEYLGEVVVPTKIDQQAAETKSLHMFRTVGWGAALLEQSGSASPQLQLVDTMRFNRPGSVTLIDHGSLQSLMALNGINVRKRSDEQAQNEKEERAGTIHTVVVEPGKSCAVGRMANFSDVIGSQSMATSRQHFMVTVSESGVMVQDTSANGTQVKIAPQPARPQLPAPRPKF